MEVLLEHEHVVLLTIDGECEFLHTYSMKGRGEWSLRLCIGSQWLCSDYDLDGVFDPTFLNLI